MKYLLFTLDYPPQKGGVANYYEKIASYWPEKNLTILAEKTNGGQDDEKTNYRTLISKYLRPRWLPSLWQLFKFIKNNPRAHIIAGQILPLGTAAYLLKKILKFDYSIILHGLDLSLALKKPKITKKILLGAKKIICSNNHAANLLKVFDMALAEKIFVVNPGIEPSFIRNPRRVQELQEKYDLKNKLVLLSLGRLVKRKGFDAAIAALALAEKNNPNIILAIGGSGPEEESLKSLAAKQPENIQEKIIFLGKLSDADRWAWLELCDIFIMASRNIAGDFEGFGIVYLEANLAGKPVIAGDSGGVRDAVIDGVNGLLVDPEKPEDLAKAIIKLSGDASLRQALGEHGKRRVVENFNAKKQVEKLIECLVD